MVSIIIILHWDKTVICKLCDMEKHYSDSICQQCSYDNDIKKVTNKNSLKNYYKSIKARHWADGNEFLLKLYELSGNSYERIGALVDISKTGVHNKINLAKIVRIRPELRERGEVTAQKISCQSISTMVFDNENDMQKFLYKNWNEISFVKKGGWAIYSNYSLGRYDTKKVGEIDFLAKNEKQNKWLVIEIKKEQTSDKTIGQLLRYMGWVKKEKSLNNDNIEGLILCGEYDSNLDYAVSCIPNVNVKIYRYDLGKIFFYPFSNCYIDLLHHVNIKDDIPPENKEEIIKTIYESSK